MKPVSTREKIMLELVGGMSPQAVQRDRQLANTQFGEATSGAPVQHWTQALNRVAQGLGSSMRETRAATAEQEAATLQRQALTDALAGGDLGNAATTLLNNAGTADQGVALAGKVIADRQAQARAEAERNRPLTPMQQADLEYKRAQTDKLRRDDGPKIIAVNGRVLSVAPDGTATEVFNAQPQPDQGTDDIQEYRFAQQGGYEGSFMDFMAAKKGAAGGMKPPAGYMVDPKDQSRLAPIPGGPDDPASKSLTEGQTKDAFYASRMLRAEKTLDSVVPMDETGKFTKYDPTKASNNAWFDDSILNSQQWRNYYQAARESMAAILRKDTGAAITNQEFEIYFPLYYPQPGDGPDVVLQKKRAREEMAAGIARGSGPAFDRMFPGAQIPQSGSGGGPALRIETEDQYRQLPPGSRYVAPDGSERVKQ